PGRHPTARVPALRKVERKVDLGADLDRLSVEQRRPIDPLLDCFPGRRYQKRMTRYNLDIPDMSVRSDDAGEPHNALNPHLVDQGRIGWLDPLDQHGGLDVTAHADSSRRLTRDGQLRF